LALGAYRWYALKPQGDRYAAVAVLYAAGLMCKPQVITLPFVLLLWDYWPLRRMFAEDQQSLTPVFRPRRFSDLVSEKVPLLALAAVSAGITIKAQSSGVPRPGIHSLFG
jgi:protein O-mannosyl-transferase